MTKLTKEYLSSVLRERAGDSHKGSHGHALLIAGNRGRAGAAVLAARACLRSGCGLLTVMIPAAERGILQTNIPEAMLSFDLNKPMATQFDAIGFGPAVGTDPKSKELFKILAGKKSIVLDADALTLLAKNKNLWKAVPQNAIITPHPKEFDKLFGDHLSADQRRDTAIKSAKEKKIIIVLKGHRTFITNGEDHFENSSGNSGLAKGGSGDMLTGMITSFLAQKYSPLDAACIAVYLHGLAADITLSSQSVESMLASDVIENIGAAFKQVRENKNYQP